MADQISADVAIIGAGIAGAGVAAHIAADLKTVILEQEDRPGHHSTGRSAAIFLRNYGNKVIRTLTWASAPLYEGRDETLFPSPLLSQRGSLCVTNEEGLQAFSDLLAESEGLTEISIDEAIRRVPILNRKWLAGVAYEADTHDIDVAALHEGWLRHARSHGAALICNAAVTGATRENGVWTIETPAARVKAKTIVNAAGAWADHVASSCGVERIGLQPMRRSMAVLPAPEGYDLRGWPMIDDAREQWYCKPDGGRLFVSPAEEDPVDPHDAYADDMVLAEGLYRFEQAVTIPVSRVERSWAGLRSFVNDRTPVVGFDRTAEGFFWVAGQGGYGIQTGPALYGLAGDLLRGKAPSSNVEGVVEALSPDRLR
jgi:D-arginine dehydrogenase